MQVLGRKKQGEKKFNRMVENYVEAARNRFSQKLSGEKADLCVGTGGNLDALSDLKEKWLHKKESSFVTLGELEALLAKLQKYSYEDRVAKLGLRPDRADVILPASLVLHKIMQSARVSRVHIPRVGVKEGLLLDMVSELLTGRPPLHRDEVLASARRTGSKYAYDERHADTVSRLAMDLFDKTKKLHRLADDHKLVLEVAARLHDIGQFVNYNAHHKHSYYLIRSSPLVGLHQDQVEIAANVSRYHRKAIPKMTHESYRLLRPRDRVLVSKLAAILRVADAMDHEHASKVNSFRIRYKRPHFSLKLMGKGDLSLEKWALLRKGDLFEKVFKVKFSVKS
jgi:exopolyphosphatase/guanosine-5'-triphosphate,3'-diphosphate pyrophosphatase